MLQHIPWETVHPMQKQKPPETEAVSKLQDWKKQKFKIFGNKPP